MGSRADMAIIENGKTSIFFHHWQAQQMDVLGILGPEKVREFFEKQFGYGTETPDEQETALMDCVWAEGGLLADYDSKTLLLYGGEDLPWDAMWLTAYMALLQEAWPSWDVRWASAENVDIGIYLGLSDDELGRIGLWTFEGPEKPSTPIDEKASEYDDARGLLTIRGEKGTFSRRTSNLYFSDLLRYGAALGGLYETMAQERSTDEVDCRPNEYTRSYVAFARDFEEGKRRWGSSPSERDDSWPEIPCGYSKDDIPFPEYGVFMDMPEKRVLFWEPTREDNAADFSPLFGDEWTVVSTGWDYRPHLRAAGNSIEITRCPLDAYFDVIEGWTLRTVWSDGREYSVDADWVSNHFAKIRGQYYLHHPEPENLPW